MIGTARTVSRAVRRLCAGVVLVLPLLSLASCGTEFSESQACELAEAYLGETKPSGWQHLDLDYFPAAGYRNVEVVECTDFRSKLDQGWASVTVHARGDAFEPEEERFLGRTIFTAEIEFEGTGEGWRVLEKGSF